MYLINTIVYDLTLHAPVFTCASIPRLMMLLRLKCSCTVESTDKLLSRTQLVMINQLQDVSTWRSLSPAYRMIQLTKTSGLKYPAVNISFTVMSCSRICYQCGTYIVEWHFSIMNYLNGNITRNNNERRL